MAMRISKKVMEEVHQWGSMKQHGVTLKYMMEFGSNPTDKNLLLSAQFLHSELPVRIARRSIELENLPCGLSKKPAVLKAHYTIVRDWYLDSFRDLRSFREIKDMSDEKEFTKIIKAIKVRHDNVVPTMALGVSQLKRTMNANTAIEDHTEIHEFLDRFFLSRIGIRMLIGQHLELHKPNPNPNCVGCIHKKMSPLDVTRNAIEDARAMCYREYGNAPEVTIYGDPDFTFPYVPSHLHHMVFELVKNSLRAIQERFMDDDRVAPPIRIIIADGIEDVTIKGVPQAKIYYLNFDLNFCMLLVLLMRYQMREEAYQEVDFQSYLHICIAQQEQIHYWMKIQTLELLILSQWLAMVMASQLAACMLSILVVTFKYCPWKDMAQMHICIYVVWETQKNLCLENSLFSYSFILYKKLRWRAM
ncbi:hypothetical protein HN51_025726 [Arachis hypogaea]